MTKFEFQNADQLRTFDRAIFEFLKTIETRADSPAIQIDGYQAGAATVRAVRCGDKDLARELARFIGSALQRRTVAGLR